MLIETLLYTVLCWGILERAQGFQAAMATQREAHLSFFQDLGDQFFHCSLFSEWKANQCHLFKLRSYDSW